jgi:hypothetical protein
VTYDPADKVFLLKIRFQPLKETGEVATSIVCDPLSPKHGLSNGVRLR